MKETSTLDIKGPGPFDLGLCHQEAVCVSSDKTHVRFDFDFRMARDDKLDTVTFYIHMTAEHAMGLLLTLQETQRIERFPLPSIPILTERNRGSG